MTAGHAVLKPEAAQAGVIGGLKSAAKKVGSTVKTAAVTVGSAGKTIGVGIGRNARQGAESLARSPLGYAVKSSIRPVVNAVRR